MKTNGTKKTSKPMDNKPILIKSAPNGQKADWHQLLLIAITLVVAIELALDIKRRYEFYIKH
jgi:hypothetical protein